MKEELSIIPGGLTPKRPPHIIAEMAKAAEKRKGTTPEMPQAEIIPVQEKETHKLHIKFYNDNLGAIIEFDTEEELIKAFDDLKDAYFKKAAIEIILDGAVCLLRGGDIESLKRKKMQRDTTGIG